MLYPTNIIIKHKRKREIIKNKIQNFIKSVKISTKYLIFDRKNLNKIIAVKLHI